MKKDRIFTSNPRMSCGGRKGCSVQIILPYAAKKGVKKPKPKMYA